MKCCPTLCLSCWLLQFGTQQWSCTGILLSCCPLYSLYYCLPLFGVPFYYAIDLLADDYALALRLRKCKPAVELTQPFSQGSRYVARWLTRAELMDTGCDHTMILTSSVTPSAVDRTRCTGVVCVWRHNVLYYSYSRATSLLVAREESGDAAPRGL